MSASIRHSGYYASDDEKPVLRLQRDRTKPRYYGKKKAVLKSYHKRTGTFLTERANNRAEIAINTATKWETRINNLLN